MQPAVQRLHDRPASFLAHGPAVLGGLAADFVLDGL